MDKGKGGKNRRLDCGVEGRPGGDSSGRSTCQVEGFVADFQECGELAGLYKTSGDVLNYARCASPGQMSWRLSET